jgi:nucleoside-diphosphate-sugar epimerase
MILLIGHGYVGQHVAAELRRQKIDHCWISHHDPIPSNSELIINAAGYTGVPNVDACEVNKQQCVDGNVVWPVQLEQNHPLIPKIHISSGCVYTGYKPGGYTELDPPNFDFDNGSFYSGSKALAQRLLMPWMNRSWLLRIRMPFGSRPDPKNLFTKLENYPQLVDFENSVTNVEDLARVVAWFSQNRPPAGIYNVTNPGSVRTKDVADELGLQKTWLSEEEFAQRVSAPRSNCVLLSSKLCALFPLSSAERSLQLTAAAYRANR